jgi:hypothetical protein
MVCSGEFASRIVGLLHCWSSPLLLMVYFIAGNFFLPLPFVGFVAGKLASPVGGLLF